MSVFSGHDHRFMAAALSLARRGLGSTAPNPTVGCIIVKDGAVIGRGWTQPGGRPHAETEALAQAGEAARGATAYVTLEPCSHQGKTPPCADALIEAGLSRVVVAVGDPNPKVNGAGLAKLRAAGVTVEHGLEAEQAAEINTGFFLKVRAARPYFALKAAMSLDGRIALASGESHWITGADARRFGHSLRASHDAVLVGSGTALADDPALTCRLPGWEGKTQPIRIVLDRRLRLTVDNQLVRTARELRTWVVTAADSSEERRAELEACGLEIISLDAGTEADFARDTAHVLAEQGLTRVLIEGGGEVAAAFLGAGLIDRLYALHAPMVLGGDGRPAVGSLNLARLSDTPRFRRVSLRAIGEDVLEILDRSLDV